MEQSIDIQIPSEKIYSENELVLASFLGGPLVSGYLLTENFKAFNDEEKAKKTWIYTTLLCIVLIGGSLMIPEYVKVPNVLLPIIYIGIARYLMRKYQGENIAAHISSGGQFYSWGRTIVVGFLGLLVILIIIFSIALLSGTISEPTFNTKYYGTMRHEIEYDRSNITDAEVDKLGAEFTLATFFDDAVTKYVYAEKTESGYELYISVIDGIAADTEALQPFIDLRNEMQAFNKDKRIVFKLVAERLDNVVKTLK